MIMGGHHDINSGDSAARRRAPAHVRNAHGEGTLRRSWDLIARVLNKVTIVTSNISYNSN